MRPRMGQLYLPLEAVLGFSLVPTALVVVVGSRRVWVEFTTRSCSCPFRYVTVALTRASPSVPFFTILEVPI